MFRIIIGHLVAFILYVGVLLTHTNCAAQAPSKAMAFNSLGINDGLSQGMVTTILQDNYGFMWFATLDGLNRYDGYKFRVFRHDPKVKSSITSSYVQSIFEDSKQRLWIGTATGGLDLHDAETEQFVHIDKQTSAQDGLSDGPISVIAEDKYGNIWAQIQGKLDKISVQKNKAGSPNFSIKHVTVPFVASKAILFISSSGNIYFADSDDGVLYRLEDARREKWLVVFRLNKQPKAGKSSYSKYYKIALLMEDAANGKLYIFHEKGATRLNEKTAAIEKTFTTTFFSNYDIPMRGSLDEDGNFWFSSPQNLSILNIHTGEITQATTLDKNQMSVVKTSFSNYIDRSGLLWIGTSGYGLIKRNSRSEFFHAIPTASHYSITSADDGKILISNGFVVTDVFDRTTGTLTTVGGRNKNLNEYLYRPFASTKSINWYADSNVLRQQEIVSKKSIDYPLPVALNNEFEKVIQHACSDLNGDIWLATTQGLLQFLVREKKWRVFKNNPSNVHSISANVVFSLILDPIQPQRYLWVGTSGGGLNKLDLHTKKFIAYSTKDGLPNDVIYGILPDDAGNLWVSTNKGLSCFNITNQNFRNFDYKEGLQSNEFNRGAYHRTTDGVLFFGGVSGFNYFHPEEILKNVTVPQVLITGLKIKNEQVVVGTPSSVLEKSIHHTQQLTLPYEQNFLSLEFAAMDFTYPEKNRYRYKLQGLNKDWINAGTTNQASFTNLDPGNYTFLVQGSNNDGTWNEKGASIQLVILPPWYMTWWFRLGMLLLVFAGLYALYRNRLRQALKVQEIRNGIAIDQHDEVGSNLSNIYIYSNVAQQKEQRNETTEPLLQKITEHTKQSMEAMTDIVWMINTRNDGFENIMAKMRIVAAEFTETCDCNLIMDLDEKLNDIKLDIDKRKNFYLIYREAINNVAKYAGCSTLWVTLKFEHKKIMLTIKDNGKGFDMDNKKIGNGLLNMKKRSENLKGELSIESQVGKGTTLLLSFPT